MPEMLRPPDRDRMIAFLDRRLLAEADGTAGPDQGWTPEALAHAVELLAQPRVRDRWAGLAARMTDRLLALGREGRLLRGHMAPGLSVEGEAEDFRIRTGAYEFSGDLSRGLIRQRLPGGREILHTGNLLEFRSGGAFHCLDVEDATNHYALEHRADGSVVLMHESLFSAPAGLMRKRRFVGRLRYEYTIRPDDPRLRVSVMLKTAPKVTLRDIRLTTALDELSGAAEQPGLGRIVLGAGGRHAPLAPQGEEVANLHLGAAESLSLVEQDAPGPATGLHLGYATPARLLSIKLVRKAVRQGEAPRPHWLVNRYRVPELTGGQSAEIVEERLLTQGDTTGEDAGQGGTEASAAAWLRDPALLDGRLPGWSGGEGRVLNAVATQLLLAQRAAAPPSQARLDQLRALRDRQLAACRGQLHTAPPLDLAFLLLGLDTLSRLNPPLGEDAIPEALAALLDRQREDGTFAATGQAPGLAGQAAAILALARLVLRQPEPALLEALRRALGALQLGQTLIGQGEKARLMEVPRLHALEQEEQIAQPLATYALLMRALGLLFLPQATRAMALPQAEQEALRRMFDASFRQLRHRLRENDGVLEAVAEEGADEALTQSLVTLALLAPDEAVLQYGAEVQTA